VLKHDQIIPQDKSLYLGCR